MSDQRHTRSPGGRLIAFEGVDGAGKSTALALVAERLRARGERVFVPRVGKHHASCSVRAIRDLTRNRRHLDLDARAELLLYCAREAQILRELVLPALREGCSVLIDRSLLTPIVLGRARGLSHEECERAASLASAGVTPDLTLIFDVHPRTSRIRKRMERIRSGSKEEGGRKGLAGSAFKERIRDSYSSTAREHGHPILCAERASPTQLAEQALDLISRGEAIGAAGVLDANDPWWTVPRGTSLLTALEGLPAQLALYFGDGLICGRAWRRRHHRSEPRLCAATLDPEDPLRTILVHSAPELALRASEREPLSGDADPRLRWLPRHTAACIQALKHQRGAPADALREAYAASFPDAVLSSLQGREDTRAVAIRARCWEHATPQARAVSLVGCRSEAAWRERDALFDLDPVLGLSTLRGLWDPRAQRWLDRYAAVAPKPVVEALEGRSDPEAHALRSDLFDTGREVVDSTRGLDDETSWALRERAQSLWPSSVVHSLLDVQPGPRVQTMLQRCIELGSDDLHLHRRWQQLIERPLWPAWARARPVYEDPDHLST